MNLPYLYSKLKPSYRLRSIDEIYAAPLTCINGVSSSTARNIELAYRISTMGVLFKNLRNIYAHFNYLDPCKLFYPSFDPGPNCGWQFLFSDIPHDSFPAANFRKEFGPVFYRGRLDGTARVMVVGQDPSTDEALAKRAMVGQAGQLVQKYLERVGIDRSYIIVNTFAYSMKSSGAIYDTLSESAGIRAYRERIFDKIVTENPLQAIICFGALARKAVYMWGRAGAATVYNLTHPTAPDTAATLSDWNSDFDNIYERVTPDVGLVRTRGFRYDIDFHYDVDLAKIPARDLPFGTPEWFGTGGTKSKRDTDRKIILSVDGGG
ncbi:MAG: hypothetical protein M0D57_01865 [Sphingobacteriales bacterium JAD_PAG50586_3]|nr:MAG: hypothetical protein M0D57_01865 [Sphingobacteriales bacterium JAD_PAG50586_3]